MQKIKESWNKSEMTQIDGETYHVLGLEESIPSKWLYYPKQSTDSMQPLSNYQWHFSLEQTGTFLKLCGNTKYPK